MNKYVLGIDRIKCEMCESHVQDIIRKAIKVKKVKASHVTGKAVVITEFDISEEDFKKIFEPTGYKVVSYEKGEAVKKFLGWK